MAPLELVPPLGRYFTFLKPMEPRSAEKPFDSPEHLFQVKWDGVRILAFIEEGRVRLQNRKGGCRTKQYPELQVLPQLVRGRELLLDGEVVVMEEGRPSFPRVIQRDFCRRESTIRALVRHRPCTYCVFDLLYLDGKDLTGRPFLERQQILQEILLSQAPVYLNDNFSGGVQLYREVERRGLEGIVAKEKESPYRFGEKGRSWLKIKPRRRLLCVVGGLAWREGTVRALLLGGYREEELLYIGRAGSGLSHRHRLMLGEFARRHRREKPPFVNPPRERDCLWLEPTLTVWISFFEWTAGLSLRAPVVEGFSDRRPAEAKL